MQANHRVRWFEQIKLEIAHNLLAGERGGADPNPLQRPPAVPADPPASQGQRPRRDGHGAAEGGATGQSCREQPAPARQVPVHLA